MSLGDQILGMELNAAKKAILAENPNVDINVILIQGNKDKEILSVPRVVKISPKDTFEIDLIATFFASPL